MPKLTKKLSITEVRTYGRTYGRTDPNYRKASVLKSKMVKWSVVWANVVGFLITKKRPGRKKYSDDVKC